MIIFPMHRARRAGVAVLCLALAFSCCDRSGADVDADPDHFSLKVWNDPPMQFRPRLRWWWPGGSVEEDELARELRLFQKQGFGGIEIQPFSCGLTEADLRADPQIQTVGTEDFFGKAATVCRAAEELEMPVSLTFGSGWPTGGPFIREHKARQLLMASTAVTGPVRYNGPLPVASKPTYHTTLDTVIDIMAPFDAEIDLVAVTAAGIEDPDSTPREISGMVDLTESVDGDRLVWEVPGGDWILFAFYENRSQQRVFPPAYSPGTGEAFVHDHLRREGLEEMISGFGIPLVDSLDEYLGSPLEGIFVDSFEFSAELPWTTGFLERFREETGYDLRPYLPLLFRDHGEAKWLETMFTSEEMYASGEVGERVREDYEEVRGYLFHEGYVRPLLDWAHSRGLAVRMQNHGGYADFLDGYGEVDIPESEGLYAGGSYDFLKLAASAGHTSGRRYISSEAFVAIVGDPRGITREDFYLLGGRALSAGVNRLYHHGYPYLFFRTDGTQWYPFEGAYSPVKQLNLTFSSWSDEGHPVWPEFPTLNMYLARLCYAFSRGRHRARIAWLHQDGLFPDTLTMHFHGFAEGEGDSPVTQELKTLGMPFDRISRWGLEGAHVENSCLSVGPACYSGLLITDLRAATPAMMTVMETVAGAGIPVFVMGGLPARASGYSDAEARDLEVAEINRRLSEQVVEISAPDELGAALAAAGIKPPVTIEAESFPYLVNWRSIEDGELFLLANQGTRDRRERIRIEEEGSGFLVLDPQSGAQILRSSERDGLGRLTGEISVPGRRAVVVRVTQ